MKKLLLFALCLILYSDFAFTQSAKLDTQEVKDLKEIWGKLGLAGKKGWDFDKDPCSGEGNWISSVVCNCSFESNTTCHVTDISLMGNRLSGLFPTTLTRMTTLLALSIEGNRFSGPIPKEIANLKNLDKLDLSSNDFTGELPVAFAKLTSLTQLRISDNNFTGKIPNYISHWTKIERLHIQGCSFNGPIPSSISVLTRLKDLRISDLNGGASTFPRLKKLTQLNTLVLRNCLIHGTIPEYVGNLRSLATIDLSFNNLTGEIPSSFSLLRNADYIYLTGNNLTGHIPGWVFSSTKIVDVSYNHFTWDASGPKSCEQGTINVVESYSTSRNKQKNINPCLRKDYPCTKSDSRKIHSLHINCGGKKSKYQQHHQIRS